MIDLFTDDIYINYSSELVERPNFPYLFEIRTFEKCIEYLSEMVELERVFRFEAQNNGSKGQMNNLLGDEFVTRQLLNGLMASRNAYYKSSREYEVELNELATKIDNYKNCIADI